MGSIWKTMRKNNLSTNLFSLTNLINTCDIIVSNTFSGQLSKCTIYIVPIIKI